MRDTYVSEDTQIQVTNVYRRNKTKRDKMKRTFNFVLKGMMLSSVLVSSVIAGLGGGGVAKADGLNSQNPQDPNQTPTSTEVVRGEYQDEQARILNLKNSNRVLDAAIKSGQLDGWVYERVMKSLVSIDIKLDIDKKFELSSELIDEMMKTENLLSEETAKALRVNEDTEHMRNAAYTTLQTVKDKLKGLSPSEEIEIDMDTGHVTTQTVEPTVSIASVPTTPPKKVAGVTSVTLDSDGKPYGLGGTDTVTPEQHAKAKQDSADRAKAFKENAGAYVQDSKGNWSLQENKTSQPTAPKTTTASAKVANKTIYNDFDSKQYWANDMLWLVNNGYLTGYINQKHPTTGKQGTWLNPNGDLTESQMLSVLLRYDLGLKGYEQMKKDIPNPKNNWSYNHYVTAEKIGMMTKGSSKDGSYAGKQVTRGQLAQALVSMHYGQDVTLNEAIKFMFDNKITTGTNPSKGATVENFGPNTKLSRAHISAFLKRFHDVKASGNVKDVALSGGKDTVKNPPVTPKPNDAVSNNNGKDSNIYSLVPKAQKTDDVVGKTIKTKFGERSYGAKNQSEYDQTMAIVEEEASRGELDFEGLRKFTDIDKQVWNDYFFNGKTAITDKRDPSYRTQYNQKLVGVTNNFGVFKGKVKTFEELNTLASLMDSFARPSSIYANHSLDIDGKNDPVSAYDIVIKGLYDCTSEAYYINAMLDQSGIDSIVIESPGRVHAFVGIKLYEDWYVWDNKSAINGFVKLTPDFLKKGDRIEYAPNGGKESLPSFVQSIYTPKN